MPAITFSLTNILSLTSFISPLIVSFFMILYSIINDNIVKGLIYLIGLIILTFFTRILKNSLQNKQNPIASPFCNILPDPFTLSKENDIYNSPSLSTTILAYSASYILFPMIMNGHVNSSLITFFIFILGVNGGVEIQNLCTPVSGILFGLIIGTLFGIFYYTLLSASGNKSLGYFNEIPSNNIQCAKPGKKQFKCNMYKNGQKIGEVPSDKTNINNPKDDGKTDEERNVKPICEYDDNSKKIYVMCKKYNDRIVHDYNKDITGSTIEIDQDTPNDVILSKTNECNSKAQNGNWNTCGEIYDKYINFRKGKNININEYGDPAKLL